MSIDMVRYPVNSVYYNILDKRIKKGVEDHFKIPFDDFILEEWDRTELHELIDYINEIPHKDGDIEISKLDWPILYEWWSNRYTSQ